MPKPNIVKTFPAMLDLEPGDYTWCACGSCGNQPYADGSGCKGNFEAVRFSIAHAKRYKLCLCKHTKSAPYCDSAHCRL
ncbi:MAG: hypothetical protein OEZ06_14625 [Myxococcales bacterium]|nr:hypothetical protein [Myxococcales bacterium]